MQEIYNAESRTHAEKAIEVFAKTYGAKFPKAVAKITEDRDELLAFYDFPAEHWIHLRTTNPIESTFSTVKLRTKVTRGAGSPAAALAMVFKLVESAQARWRAITGAHLVPLVRAGARFENGILVEVVIDADTRFVVAVGRPVAGNRNDCKAWELSGAKDAVGHTTAIADGGYRGTGLVIPHRRERGQVELPAWKEASEAGHRC
jgi:hypothetical protein